MRRGIGYFRAEMVCLEEAGSPDDIRVRNKIDALMAKSESPFEFDTVMLDASGRIIERRTCEAREIVEDLANGVVVELVKIPGGDYLMGSTAGEDRRSEDEGPRHKVTVAPFYMGKFAITQAQWRVVVGWPNVYELLGELIECRYAAEKLRQLKALNVRLDLLRYQTRLLRDLALFDVRRYEHASRLIQQIGLGLGGWIKQQEARL